MNISVKMAKKSKSVWKNYQNQRSIFVWSFSVCMLLNHQSIDPAYASLAGETCTQNEKNPMKEKSSITD